MRIRVPGVRGLRLRPRVPRCPDCPVHGNARRRRDLGASAIELAIITAILVGLAVAVLVIINTIVTNRANEINSNNGKIP